MHARSFRSALEFTLKEIRQAHPFPGRARFERAVHVVRNVPDFAPIFDMSSAYSHVQPKSRLAICA